MKWLVLISFNILHFSFAQAYSSNKEVIVAQCEVVAPGAALKLYNADGEVIKYIDSYVVNMNVVDSLKRCEESRKLEQSNYPLPQNHCYISVFNYGSHKTRQLFFENKEGKSEYIGMVYSENGDYELNNPKCFSVL